MNTVLSSGCCQFPRTLIVQVTSESNSVVRKQQGARSSMWRYMCCACRHIVEFKGVGCMEPHTPESMTSSLFIVQEFMSGDTLKVTPLAPPRPNPPSTPYQPCLFTLSLCPAQPSLYLPLGGQPCLIQQFLFSFFFLLHLHGL